MGMFDCIEINVSCPVCGNSVQNTFQTKDFENMMDTYHPGDHVGTPTARMLKFMRAYTTCDHKRVITKVEGELVFMTITGVWIEYHIPIIDGIIAQDMNLWTRFIEPSMHNALTCIPEGYTEEQMSALVYDANRKNKRDILITKWEHTHNGTASIEQ